MNRLLLYLGCFLVALYEELELANLKCPDTVPTDLMHEPKEHTMEITVTAHNALATAQELNDMFEHGSLTMVNGREVVSKYGHAPANSWQNGTVSVSVKGRTKGTFGTVYVKVGSTLRAS